MKKVYLDNLPRYEWGPNKGRINWMKSIGISLNFINEDIIGSITILEYDKCSQKVKIKYKDKILWFYTASLINSKISRLTKRSKLRKDFKYSIGDIVFNFEILDKFLEQTNTGVLKRYKYKCLKCGHVGEKREHDISLKGCPVCNGSFVDANINGIKITHPNVFSMIIDNDAQNYSYGSAHKVHWKCPLCNGINYSAINHLTSSKPVSCQYCGDGFSYPEKILYSALSYVSNTFEKHKKFSWSNGKIYDAFDNGIFIEIHGSQHYIKSFERCGGKTLNEEIENDIDKKTIASIECEKFIDYITIKAYPEDFETIKNNILNSNLRYYYNLSEIDWESVKNNAKGSLVCEVSNYYNKGYPISEIASIVGIDYSTVIKYLHRSSDIGLSNYDPVKNVLNAVSKRVKCINTNEIFESYTKAAKWCGLKSVSGISKCANGIKPYKTAGYHPVTGERLMWELA